MHADPIGAFREWLAQQLRIRRLSQGQLAQRSGIHRSTISRLLAGERAPTFEAAVRIADALGSDCESDSPWQRALGHGAVSAVTRVERALRADEELAGGQIHRVMQLYLHTRAER